MNRLGLKATQLKFCFYGVFMSLYINNSQVDSSRLKDLQYIPIFHRMEQNECECPCECPLEVNECTGNLTNAENR